jgi:serine/threonine-protein kinase
MDDVATVRGKRLGPSGPPDSDAPTTEMDNRVPPTVKKAADVPSVHDGGSAPSPPAPPIPKLSQPPAPVVSPSSPPPPDKRRAHRFFAKDDDRRWLDRYELISEIASGGMATVFLARLVGAGGFQRLVAVKRLHSNLAADAEFVRMFIEEARLAAQIHHVHAVPIIEIGSGPRGYYLVMEYIEGVTLAQIAARVGASGLPVPRRIGLRIVLDALSGLHAAHELAGPGGKLLDLIHRDCSPGNILVGVDGNSRITDFGVAREATSMRRTLMGTIKGKVSYMAPEQALPGAQIDRRADLFAMGVVLWEVLAGRRLFRADTRLDVLLRSADEPVPRLAEVAYAVPEGLDALCAKALARDPRDRFATAVEMAEAIELNGGTIASAREVAAFLRNLFGRELNERRAQIRAWLEEPGNGGPDEPVTTRDVSPVGESAVDDGGFAPKPPLKAAPGPVALYTLGSHAPSVSSARVDPPRSTRGPMSGPATVRPDSVTLPRQLVGSLDPILFDEPVSLPLTGPSPRTRRLLLAALALALLGGLVFALVRARSSPPSGPAGATSAVNQGSGPPGSGGKAE